MHVLDCIVFMLLRDGRFLAERRRLTKPLMPGLIDIPGGHMHSAETQHDALRREMGEELGVSPRETHYICTLLHRDAEIRRLHYYAVASWSGEMGCYEAEELLWLPLGAPEELDLEVDRVAVREYLRVYGQNASEDGG